MNTRDSRKNPRVIYREYTDSDGNIRIEYKDAKGNIYTEYEDTLGNFHSDQEELINDKLVDAHIQDARVDREVAHIDRADKNTSKGLLIGVIVTTVAGLTAGVIYFLNDLNNPQPQPMGTIPTEKIDPNPTPIKVVEKEVVKIVPVTVPTPVPEAKTPEAKTPEAKAPETKAPEAKAPETKAPAANNNPTVNNNITVKPSESNPAPNKTPTAKPIETTAKPAVIPNNSIESKDDSVLKNEILKTFQGNLPNNQLKVEVKNGEVVVSGNVETQEQMQQIQPLLKSIEGIKKVNVMASIEPRVTN